MTDQELDRLLDGSPGVTVLLSGPDGPSLVWLDRRALASPQAMRAAFRRTVGWAPPRHSQTDHDQIVRGIFRVIELST
jgi:hypothetical protein